ncbi:hypothetical protein KIN20_022555 [Parelaphostrongylus tenuis]|uniref:Uncharacterized protein n=1 Tax=Parelaphostrongylus tenuis TaxID=148309 RepID=A0AAD5MQG6_PARTN|nr:hypothetical protein KIN20_022555 [Parelaphostrongylus tenuis]
MQSKDFKAPRSEDAKELDLIIQDVINGSETTNFAKPPESSKAFDELPPLLYKMLTETKAYNWTTPLLNGLQLNDNDEIR